VIPTAKKSVVFTVLLFQAHIAVWRYIDVAFVRAALLAGFRHPSGSNVYPGKRVKESKNIQDPQNHGNDHDAVQN
jgi:hypothetical protein